MSTITTRSGKGSPLTNNEVDNNFTNLNTDKAELSGATFTGEIVANGGIALGDNDKATFGSGDDLQLFHNGTDSYVYDNGTGNLILQGSAAVYIQAAGTSENMATFSKDGNVTLYHNGIAKLATTSTGIDVTGTATMDGLTVDGGATTTLKAGGFTSNSEAILELAENRDGSNNLLYGFKFKTDGAGDNNFHLLRHSNSTTGNKALSVGRDNGDISFYEDTGTTPKLTWSASGEDLNFADSVKATFGAGDDLKLYHTGAHSYIDESGTGNLYIGSNNGAGVYIQGSGETLASFVDNGAVTLYHDNAVKLATTSTGIDVTGTLNVSEDVLLGSNGRIRVGSVGSLSSPTIYLDTDPNTGIYFPSTDSVGFVAGGVERLTVNNTGIDVTGTATMDGLTVDGDGLIQASTGAKLEIKSTTNFINPNDVVGSLDFVSADYNYSAQPIKGQIRSVATNPSGTGESALFLSTTETTNLKDRIKIDYNGDISFYEDTGTTPKFFWDASAEKLGIGTSSPDTVLHLAKSSAATLRLESTATALATGGVLGAIEFESNDTGSQSGVNAKINSVFTNTVGATSLQFFTSDSFAVVDSTPKMVINNVGNVGIGTSSPSAVIDTVSSGTNSQSIAKFSSASGKRAEISTDAQDDAFMYLYDSADAVKVAFRTDGNASYINGGGNVGIGTVTPVTLLDVAGENPVLTLRDSRGSGSWTAGTELGKIDFRTSDGTGIGAHSIASIGVVAGGANAASPDGELVFATGPYNTVSQERMRIDSSGNLLVGTTSADPAATSQNTVGTAIGASGYLSMTRDDAVSAFFNRKTSDGSIAEFRKDGATVGSIGTRATYLTVGTGDVGIMFNSGSNRIQPENVTTGALTDNVVDLGYSGGRFKDLYLSNKVYANYIGSSDDTNTNIYFPTGDQIRFINGGNESARIDLSGNLLVGTTDTAPSTNNVEGIVLRNEGHINVSRASGVVGYFNRKTDDGTILDFRKDGTSVGSIGSVAGGYTMYNSESGTGYLGVNGAATYAWDATKVYHNTDATGDLGLSNRRFKDAYLSGGVYLGGTGAANKLDDYETGTWAVAVFDASSGGNESATAVNGYYTKIGNLVHCNFIMNNIDTSGLTGANPIYWSLPFGVASTENALGQVTGNFNNGSIVQVHPYAAQNSGRIFLLTHKDNGNEGFIVVSDFSDDSDDVIISLSYRTS